MLFVITLLLLIAGALAPLESLGWWAGWYSDQPGPDDPLDIAPVVAPAESDNFVVYLSGIGSITGDIQSAKEDNFLDLLAERLPDAVIVRDVFPYSVTNTPLTGQRVMAWFWRMLHWLRLHRRDTVLNYFLFARNMFQVAVSADHRYGPIYSFGIAREIAESLLRRGFQPGGGQRLTLIGLSGGAQIAVGAAPLLGWMVQARVRVISVGGVLTDDPAVFGVERLYHLAGSRDRVQHIGAFLYPGRWRWNSRSAWNLACRRGTIRVVPVGPIKHLGRGDYFSRSARLPNGQPHVEHIVDIVADLLRNPAAIDELQAAPETSTLQR